MKIISFVLFLSTACYAQTEHDITVMAMGNYTTPSIGEFNDSHVIQQSNRTSIGGSAGYELWKHGNGFVTDYSFTTTDSKLFSLNPSFKFSLDDSWKLDRNEIDLMYEHRFRAKAKIHPYLGLGGFAVVLWGGPAPAHSNVNHTGWDGWGGEVETAGFVTNLYSHISLKTGVLADNGYATTYGDTTYHASRNVMIEPQLGLVFRIGR